ncbi:MAG TPA: GTP-binding protein [Cycloclasticus sp.]|jgi:G3E family GTPase|nr:GTP-binding protein [Cycloclasticus sp.]HIL93377.1 GTP-binding protein [Cycloclasticus sp.]
MASRQPLTAIPTHVFMGFLGSGKTSAILNLFETKPADEHWAVLVNEYGQLGIDGAHYQSQGITVKEIPGGCMCCASGVPMQVAINKLLKQSRPDRLFVETSGLGHPDGVLKTLNGEHFQKALSLKASFCLLDPEKLLNPARYANGLLEQQIALADILIANKVDLASTPAMDKFDSLVEHCLVPKLIVAKTSFGVIDSNWLELEPVVGREKDAVSLNATLSADEPTVSVFSRAFNLEQLFCRQKLEELFKRTQPTRIKAICQTDNGWLLFNGEGERLTMTIIQGQQQSRFDIILESTRAKERLEQEIESCIL